MTLVMQSEPSLSSGTLSFPFTVTREDDEGWGQEMWNVIVDWDEPLFTVWVNPPSCGVEGMRTSPWEMATAVAEAMWDFVDHIEGNVRQGEELTSQDLHIAHGFRVVVPEHRGSASMHDVNNFKRAVRQELPDHVTINDTGDGEFEVLHVW